jgi:hypothetical protein
VVSHCADVVKVIYEEIAGNPICHVNCEGFGDTVAYLLGFLHAPLKISSAAICVRRTLKSM